MTGVLSDKGIRALVTSDRISADVEIVQSQIQPASLDLRLGTTAYRVRASFLAGMGRTITDRLADFTMHEVDLTGGAVLEKGCVYVVPLLERLDLPQGLSGAASAKSSIGRLDLLTRIITDHGTEFDRVPDGYVGPLYVEICPQSFSVIAQTGQLLNQIIFRDGQTVVSDAELEALHARDCLLYTSPSPRDLSTSRMPSSA